MAVDKRFCSNPHHDPRLPACEREAADVQSAVDNKAGSDISAPFCAIQSLATVFLDM